MVNFVVVTIANIGSALGPFFLEWVVGWLFTNRGPEGMLYVVMGCTVAVLIIQSMMQVSVKLLKLDSIYKCKRVCEET